MNQNIYKLNRDNLLNKIKDNSIVILFAGKAIQKTGDQTYPFTPNRNFYYLTGIKEEEHILVMSKINGIKSSKLYIKDIDLELEKWIGKSIRKEEASELTAVDEVKFKSQFDADIHSAIVMKEEINLYLDLEKMSANREGTISHRFANEIVSKYPQVRINNVYSKIGELRLKKSQEEIEKIKKAIVVKAKPVAPLTLQLKSKYASNSELKENDLILFDLGAEYNCYNADISRTFPVNGKFTERQKEVYNSVLKVNEEIIKLIKPGMKYKDVNEKATDLIAEECIKLGIIDDKKDVRKYYYHSIGHSLGMDTHDIETPHRDITFEPGVVFTVEPGIYIEEEGIGIRIEDDILVTEDGVINLSSDIIKSVDEIEEFMKKAQNK